MTRALCSLSEQKLFLGEKMAEIDDFKSCYKQMSLHRANANIMMIAALSKNGGGLCPTLTLILVVMAPILSPPTGGKSTIVTTVAGRQGPQARRDKPGRWDLQRHRYKQNCWRKNKGI